MSEQRRRELEAPLATDAQDEPDVSRMSRICTGCVPELAVSGAGATVLTHLGGR